MSKERNKLIIFLIKFCLLYLVWELVYSFYIQAQTDFDSILTASIASISTRLLNFFELPIEHYSMNNGCQMILFDAQKVVMIAHPCNGLILHVLFAIFLICFKGHWLVKITTLILGMVAIYTINVLRVVALIQIAHYHRDWLDFSHKWLFTAIVYSCVFGIWLLWVNKLSKINPFRS